MGRFVLWLLLAWPAPALIAGALGWKGIWGSNSALVDYLIPVPVAGGAFHAMTFAGISVLLVMQKQAGFVQGITRGLLLAVSIIGFWLLYDFERNRLLDNPIGLFLLTDSLIAQLFVTAFGGRWPASGREWLGALAASALLPGVAIGAIKAQDPRTGQQFVHAGSRPGPGSSDESYYIFSKLPVATGAFQPAAAAYVAQTTHIAYSINSEDFAFYFFDNLAAAQMNHDREAAMTYCVYQDGTPSWWAAGKADCFSGHETTRDRFQKHFEALDRQIPQQERIRLARAKACEGVRPQATDNAIAHNCGRRQP